MNVTTSSNCTTVCASLRVVDNDCVLIHAPQEAARFFFFLKQIFYSDQISLHCISVISVPEEWHRRPKAEFGVIKQRWRERVENKLFLTDCF